MFAPTIESLLMEVVKLGASDLHISVGKFPYVRQKDGRLVPLNDFKVDRSFFEKILQRVLKTENAAARLFEKEEIDVTYQLPNGERFRVNIGLARGVPFAVFRHLRSRIPDPFQLGIPEEFVKVVEEAEYGLILLGGTTGSGKSTTLASCINYILKKYEEKVVTIEDPVEYLIGEEEGIKGYVVQREVGRDTKSFANALRAAMRQDPDYIVVGEVRDVETGRYCILAAETGHVVFATIHVKDAVSAVSRYIGMFPYEEQEYLRMRLIDQLLAIQVQFLLPSVDGGRVLATEFLKIDDEVRELLQKRKVDQVRKLMKERKVGWVFEDDVKRLFKEGKISREVALSFLSDLSG